MTSFFLCNCKATSTFNNEPFLSVEMYILSDSRRSMTNFKGRPRLTLMCAMLPDYLK
jgi:hypothetical protein